MKKSLLNVLKFLFFLSAGVFLFWLVYKDIKIGSLVDALNGVDYEWIWLSVSLGLLSHFIRALRWKMLIKPLGYNPGILNSFFSVMVLYIGNLAIPRLGEVSRPAVLKKYEGIPFSKGFGTIVTERVIDLFCLFILTIIALFFEGDILSGFLKNNPAVGDKFEGISFSNTFVLLTISIIGIGVLALIILRNKIKHTTVYKKIKDILRKFAEGLISIIKVKNLFLFILESIAIWVLYFMMMYVCFHAFDFTENLSVMIGLTAFVMGSFGMLAPVQGGIGAWHFMVIGTLVLLGISERDAGIFALVVHGSQTLMLIVVGAISIIALPLFNKDRKIEMEKDF